MAHNREGPDLVLNTRYVGSSEIRAASQHELNRDPDGSSAIDPLRSHLNQILLGPATQSEAIKKLDEDGVKKPARQSERPYVQQVISASPSYFRDDDQGPGEWNQDRLDRWLKVTMDHLQKEHGRDLIHVSLHLDEDTPHLHVLIAPLYGKKQRIPGKQKRGETPEQFEARKQAAREQSGTVTVGRSSSEYWKRHHVRRHNRQSYHRSLQDAGLNIGYGHDFVADRLAGEAAAKAASKSTRQWVNEELAQLNDQKMDLELDKKEIGDKTEKLASAQTALFLDESKMLAKVDASRTELQGELKQLKEEKIKLANDRAQLELDRQGFEDERAGLILDRYVLDDEKATLIKNEAQLVLDRSQLALAQSQLALAQEALRSDRDRSEQVIAAKAAALDELEANRRANYASDVEAGINKRLPGLVKDVMVSVYSVLRGALKLNRLQVDYETSACSAKEKISVLSVGKVIFNELKSAILWRDTALKDYDIALQVMSEMEMKTVLGDDPFTLIEHQPDQKQLGREDDWPGGP